MRRVFESTETGFEMNAKDLFGTHGAVLEYRPVRHDGGILWYWVLLPLPNEDRALATGSAASKGLASVAGRQYAHMLHRRVTKVRTFGLDRPTMESLQEAQADPRPETRKALRKLFKPGSKWKRTNFRFPTTTFDRQTMKRAVLAEVAQPIVVTVGRVLVDSIEFILPDGQRSYLSYPDGKNATCRVFPRGLEVSDSRGVILLYDLVE